MVPLSILDLVRITEGGSVRTALDNARDLARHAEGLGYRRFWVAEHHNIPSIASAATSLVVAHVAAGTQTIRVGAGGTMLPNHSPLVIAEQFGTLAHLFPGRIDLGPGRAPGTDPATVEALRRSPDAAERFPEDVLELQALLAPASRGSASRPSRAWGRRCRSGSSGRARSARRSPRNSVSRTRSPRTSRPSCSCRPSPSTAAASSRRGSSIAPTPWSA